MITTLDLFIINTTVIRKGRMFNRTYLARCIASDFERIPYITKTSFSIHGYYRVEMGNSATSFRNCEDLIVKNNIDMSYTKSMFNDKRSHLRLI